MRPALEHSRAISSALLVRRWTYDAARPFRAAAASHATFEVSWIERGSVAMSIGAHEHEVEAGGAILVPAGVEHVTTFPRAMAGGSVHLGAAMFEELAPKALSPGVIEGDRTARIARLLAEEAAYTDQAAILAAD